jgi:hypothetical protein
VYIQHGNLNLWLAFLNLQMLAFISSISFQVLRGRVTQKNIISVLSSEHFVNAGILSYRVARWYIFKPKNPNLGKKWCALEWKLFAYFMVIWTILRPFGILYCHLVMLWQLGTFLTVLKYFVSRKIWQPCYRHGLSGKVTTHYSLSFLIVICNCNGCR